MAHEFHIIIKSKFNIGNMVKIRKEVFSYKYFKNKIYQIIAITYLGNELQITSPIYLDNDCDLEYEVKNIKNEEAETFVEHELLPVTKKDKIKFL